MAFAGPFLRGRIYAATLEHVGAEKYYVVVSNNARNRALASALVVRVTSTRKPDLPSIVSIPAGEMFEGGYLVCDDITELYPDEVRIEMGAYGPRVMRLVDDALCAALGIVR